MIHIHKDVKEKPCKNCEWDHETCDQEGWTEKCNGSETHENMWCGDCKCCDCIYWFDNVGIMFTPKEKS